MPTYFIFESVLKRALLMPLLPHGVFDIVVPLALCPIPFRVS